MGEERRSAWIFEDDYDSEFRYAGPPLTALAGIGGERRDLYRHLRQDAVRGLRLAYLVLPPPAGGAGGRGARLA